MIEEGRGQKKQRYYGQGAKDGIGKTEGEFVAQLVRAAALSRERHRNEHQRLHQHRVLGVGGDVASPVSLHRFNLIHFVFSETDGAKATDAEAEADYDE